MSIVGHDLVAQIAGQLGIQLKTNGFIVNRITALDPAGACFKDSDNYLKLNSSDADFVEVIRTQSAGYISMSLKGVVGMIIK